MCASENWFVSVCSFVPLTRTSSPRENRIIRLVFFSFLLSLGDTIRKKYFIHCAWHIQKKTDDKLRKIIFEHFSWVIFEFHHVFEKHALCKFSKFKPTQASLKNKFFKAVDK